ncbi:MAG: hypothetical protein R3B72_42325 [Polyangiaceae bacterium]
MPGTIDTHGEIEIICQAAGDLGPHKTAKLVFRAWDDAPPYEIKVWSPSNNLIVERVIRVLPTGEPQSPPPVSFSVQRGTYEIHVQQINGGAQGRATLKIT